MPFQNLNEVPYDYVINSHFFRSMIKTNGNILGCVLGKTRSGKSWLCLSICESWYKHHFKTDFPHENICFTVDELLDRLSGEKLKRGEILILEEAGVNMGNLDFQSKLAKAVNYVLQSFGSLNIGLLINLPYFTMLNRSTRMLMKMMIKVEGVDAKTSLTIFKMNHIEWNQYDGKMWQYRFIVKVGREFVKVESYGYPRPSKELVRRYEIKKREFVRGTIKSASVSSKNPFSPEEVRAYYLRQVIGLSNNEASQLLKSQPSVVTRSYQRAVEKGMTAEKLVLFKNYYENLTSVTPKPLAVAP